MGHPHRPFWSSVHLQSGGTIGNDSNFAGERLGSIQDVTAIQTIGNDDWERFNERDCDSRTRYDCFLRSLDNVLWFCFLKRFFRDFAFKIGVFACWIGDVYCDFSWFFIIFSCLSLTIRCYCKLIVFGLLRSLLWIQVYICRYLKQTINFTSNTLWLLLSILTFV